MKNLILLFISFLFFALTSNAQTIKIDENSKLYLDTVSTSDLSKEQLFSNAVGFVSDRFKNSQNAIEQNDLEQGELFFIGNISQSFENIIEGKVNKKGKKTEDSAYRDGVTLHFKCRVYLKDNKYKVVLSNLEIPFSEVLNIGVRVPLSYPGVDEASSTGKGKLVAIEIAERFIKDISKSLNKIPENVF